MLLISFSAIIDDWIVYKVVGDVKAIHLARLEQIINNSLSRGMKVSFDMWQ